MGNWNSGRRPSPTALKILRGAEKRSINANEPKIDPVTPSFDAPPPELEGDAVAIAEWARVVPLLRVSGVITHGERAALVALCVEWSHWIEAQTKIRQLGMLVKGKADGLPVRNPYIRIANDSLKQLQRLWVELGLTPSSRSRLTTINPLLPNAPASRWGNDL
jgi:P27 family predicted phage terminase small subunit